MTRAARTAQLPLDARLDAELWIAERIAEHTGQTRPDMFAGVMTEAQRREVLRKAILANGLSSVTIGKRHGKCETYAEIFYRIFNQYLTPRNTHAETET